MKNPDGMQSSKHRELFIPLKERCITETAGKELAQEGNKSKARQNLHIKKKEMNLEAVKELGGHNVLNEAMPQGNKCGKR